MNSKIFWIIILVAGAGLLISANIFRDTNPGPVSQGTPVSILSPRPRQGEAEGGPTPSEEQNESRSQSDRGSPDFIEDPRQGRDSTKVGRPSISQPRQVRGEIRAACQLSGEIRFINENLYETTGAKIAYQNIDDKIRQIYWKSNPDDGMLSAGPNLFENLEIPNGEREIGATLKGKPQTDNYVLTAAVTYGIKEQNGDIKENIANCSGTINVDVSDI